MHRSIPFGAALAAALVLSGCSAAPAPAVTVTVSASASTRSPAPGDSAQWDLSALCAAEGEVKTVALWRSQQVDAHRLTAAQATAVLQTVAVQYLEFDARGLPADAQRAVTALQDASGTLERPSIDLESTAVRRAQQTIADVCQRSGLTIGVVAQGG